MAATLISLIAYGLMVAWFHRTLLTGEGTAGTGARVGTIWPKWGFWGAWILPQILSLIVLLGLMLILSPLAAVDLPRATRVLYLAIVAASGFSIAAVGTAIPASILGAPFGARPTLRRARASFWFILWRLALGPLPVLTLATALNTRLWLTDAPPLVALPAQAVLQALSLFASALTAAILSMAWLRVEDGRLPDMPAPRAPPDRSGSLPLAPARRRGRGYRIPAKPVNVAQTVPRTEPGR